MGWHFKHNEWIFIEEREDEVLKEMPTTAVPYKEPNTTSAKPPYMESPKVEVQAPERNKILQPSEINDPWRGRFYGMRCRTCMWYAEKIPRFGRCRRHAPTLGGFPAVYDNDWCGDHKMNEEKI